MSEFRTYIKNNKLLLSDEAIEVLKSYNIDYTRDVNLILYEIDLLLNANYDERLDAISLEIAEMNYYHNTNK